MNENHERYTSQNLKYLAGQELDPNGIRTISIEGRKCSIDEFIEKVVSHKDEIPVSARSKAIKIGRMAELDDMHSVGVYTAVRAGKMLDLPKNGNYLKDKFDISGDMLKAYSAIVFAAKLQLSIGGYIPVSVLARKSLAPNARMLLGENSPIAEHIRGFVDPNNKK